MIEALYVAASGMQSEKSHLDTISNNLANLNTPGFKRSQVKFEDLVYRPIDTLASGSLLKSAARMVGMGSNVSSVEKVFTAGDLKATGNSLDVAITGKGFFEVELENGELGYTRIGSFQVDNAGFLTIDGHALTSRIQLPPDVSEITITDKGGVSIAVGDDKQAFEVGKIELSYFLNEGGLEAIGSGLYAATNDSGRALYSEAGRNGLGNLQQGFTESSNVDLVQELIELTLAQRGFEVNSQVVRASDQVMQIINNLRQS
jgi:flagellar basal-body rod protein FlgG